MAATAETKAAAKSASLKKRSSMRLSTTPLHIMLIPTVILLFVYQYLPIMGNVIAFQRFDLFLGIRAFWESEWVGLDNFRRLFTMGAPIRAFQNTLIIAFWKITTGWVVPITVALLLNEVRQSWLKRSVQTIIYIPHFVSWVIMGGIIRQLVLSDGVVNILLYRAFGIGPIPFLQSNEYFVPLVIVTNIWKEFGFGTIVYLASIAGIDPNLYEAAVVDGAGRWQQTKHITLPGMAPIMILTLVLALRGILNAGFDQIFNLYNVQVYETGDIIDTYIYRITFESMTPQYHISTAVGLFKSGVAVIFISVSYWMAKKFAGYHMF
ncbi:MAG: ABC transporter permease [Spirochaetota bacterium]